MMKNEKLKPLCLIIVVQGLCLALGLWIHDRFVVSSAEWSVAETEINAEATPSGGLDAAGSLTAASLIQAMPAVRAITFLWTFALQSVVAYLILLRVQTEHSRKQRRSDQETLSHKKDLTRTRDAVIFGLAKLAESRDPDTGNHLERISIYSTRLASALRRHPKFRDLINTRFVQSIGISSALHDIGKVAIEDAILLKPGPLTADERRRMQLHTLIGADCIRDIERRLGNSNFLQMADEIVLSHHERWDGTGYPHQISGSEIPLTARIVAVADVYDALSVRRVYKPMIPHEKCVEMIREGAGTHFDPDIVEVFLKIESQFYEISQQFPEAEYIPAARVQADNERELKNLLTSEQEIALTQTFSKLEQSQEHLAVEATP